MRQHEAGFSLSEDPALLDLDRIEQWLAVESYWANGRSRERIVRSLENSLVYGLYLDSAQVGLFRVVTDRTTFAWLCDVFVDTKYRGLGLAQWALAFIRDDLHAMGIYRIVLATADAHGVYEKLGFRPHAQPERWMELVTERG